MEIKSLSFAKILGAIACAYGSLIVLWMPLSFISLIGLNPLFGCYDSGECWYLIPKVIEIPLLLIVWFAMWTYIFFARKVKIGAGTTINKNTTITGPVLIGENCTLEDCVINPNTTIGAGSIIKNAELSNSIILNKCVIDCDLKISGSILGSSVVIAKKGNNFHRVILGENTLIEI